MVDLVRRIIRSTRIGRRVLDRLHGRRHGDPQTGYEEAQRYVGNIGESAKMAGELQLELLKMNGCRPDSHVLEVGCGCLVAGGPMMDYLDADRYVGVEPNRWLIDAAIANEAHLRFLVQTKRPVFLHSVRFDARGAKRLFDYVISHSVLSHAAGWQYPLFLENVGRTLAPGGAILASIRMSDQDGKPMEDSNDEEWVYPGVSYFSWETVRREAEGEGYVVDWRPDYREMFTEHIPSNCHDWVVFSRP